MNEAHGAHGNGEPSPYRDWLNELSASSPHNGWTAEDWDRHNAANHSLTQEERDRKAIERKLDAAGLSLVHNSPDEGEERKKRKQRLFKSRKEYNRHPADFIRWAEGGSVIQLKRRPDTNQAPPGGMRSTISGFSSASRSRLMFFINSIDRSKVEPLQFWFLTLTYPKIFPTAPEIWKRHLQAFQKRLTRSFGAIPAIWKLEPQRRKAPHFHLLLMMPTTMCDGLRIVKKRKVGKRIKTYWTGGELASFRDWLSTAWYEIVDSGDEKHLRAGTNCEPLEAWGKVTSYASKYIGKACLFITDDGENQSVGRFWGVWCRDGFPVNWRRRYVPPATFYLVRRTLRRAMRHRRHDSLSLGRGSTTVVVSPDTIAKLIMWTESVHDRMRKEYGSTKRVMQAVGFDGDITEWYQAREDERQQRHREQQQNSRKQSSN